MTFSLATIAASNLTQALKWSPLGAMLWPASPAPAHDAGILPGRADHEEPSSGPAPLDMVVSHDIAQLLQLDGVRRPRQAGRAFSSAAAAPAAVRRANEFLDLRLREVDRWLDHPQLQAQLLARETPVERVRAQLDRNVLSLRASFERFAAEGLVVFPLVPSAFDIFSNAVLAADPVLPSTTPPAGTTAEATSAAATVPARAVAAVPRGPVVDTARQAAMKTALRNFERDFENHLPQVRTSFVVDLRQMSRGTVNFFDERELLTVVPCASSVRSSWRGITVVYPQGQGPRPFAHALLRNQEVYVSRDGNRVRLSTDGRTWRDTGVYTDDAVEAAKLQMWKRVMERVEVLYKDAMRRARWMDWR